MAAKRRKSRKKTVLRSVHLDALRRQCFGKKGGPFGPRNSTRGRVETAGAAVQADPAKANRDAECGIRVARSTSGIPYPESRIPHPISRIPQRGRRRRPQSTNRCARARNLRARLRSGVRRISCGSSDYRLRRSRPRFFVAIILAEIAIVCPYGRAHRARLQCRWRRRSGALQEMMLPFGTTCRVGLSSQDEAQRVSRKGVLAVHLGSGNPIEPPSPFLCVKPFHC